MKKRNPARIFAALLNLKSLLLGLIIAASVAAQDMAHTQWLEVDDTALQSNDQRVLEYRKTLPTEYRVFQLDTAVLRTILISAPHESSTGIKESTGEISLPRSDGGFETFKIVEAPILSDDTAALFPEIRSYSGQGIDDPTATLRFTVSSHGLYAQVLSADRSYLVERVVPELGEDLYIVYETSKQTHLGEASACEVKDGDRTKMSFTQLSESHNFDPLNLSGGAIRYSFRFAVAATGEYTAFFRQTGDTDAQAQQRAFVKITDTVTALNGILEREHSVRLLLVSNTNTVYTDGTTDPYTDNNNNAMLGENQANLDAVLGNNAYDIGHVFAFGSGGLASFNSPCDPATKAQGVSGRAFIGGSNPFRSTLYAHEVGHQFGAMHTFDATTGACGNPGQRSAITAFEVGSGSTIMGYPSTCSPNDLQTERDSYYHIVSLNQMDAFIKASNGGSSCAAQTNIGNSTPAVNAGSDFQIPRNTSFILNGSATDADGDAMTYTWEQYDLGTTPATQPLFRSYSPSSSSSRSFPSSQYVLSNSIPANISCFSGQTPPTCIVGESLPSVDRTMKFRFTARDVRANGSGSGDDEMEVTVAGSPFQVTSPNGPSTTWSEGEDVGVTWNVGGGSVATDVKITLSIDGGNTFPVVLAESTYNDGEARVVVPEIGSGTTTARVKVEAIGNIFFDISDNNFTIQDHPNFPISGRVLDETDPVGGAEIWLKKGNAYLRSVRTNSNGYYTFDFVQADFDYIVEPFEDRSRIYSPRSRPTGIVTGPVVVPDFQSRASQIYTWTQLSQVIAIQEGNPQNIQRNNYFNNSVNWEPFGVPGENDRIVVDDIPKSYLPPGGLPVIIYNPQGLSLNGLSRNINRLSLDGNSITGGILSLTGAIPGDSKFKRGLLDVVLNISAGFSFDWESGTFHSAATVAPNGYFIISGDGERTINRGGVLIDNAGEMRWYGDGTIRVTQPPYAEPDRIFTINNIGTFQIEGNGALRTEAYTEIRVNNHGTLTKSSSTPEGKTLFSHSQWPTQNSGVNGTASLTNNGTLNVLSGLIEFGQGGRFIARNNSTVQGGGKILINGELTMPLNESPVWNLDSNFEFRSGRVDGSGTINGSGIFDWTGGTFGITSPQGAGDVNVTFGPLLTVNISGNVDKHLGASGTTCGPCHQQSGILTFNGETNWSGTGDIYADWSGGSSITNNGTFNIRNDEPLRGDYFALSFTNNGTVKKLASTGTTTFGPSLNFTNAGIIDDQTGTIEFTGNFVLNANSRLKGSGTIRSKALASINSSVQIGDAGAAGNFELFSGTFAGGMSGPTPLGTLTSGNPDSRFTWTGGEIIETVNLAASLTTNITGAANKDIGRFNYHNGSPSGTLNNAGTLNINPGSVRFGYHYSTLNNTGTINIAGDVNFVGNYYTPLVTNAGTINKTPALGAAIFDGNVNVVNSGTLNAAIGLIEFNRDLYLDTGTIVKGDGVVRAKGTTRPRGTTVIGDAGNSGKFEFAAGTLEGQFNGPTPNSFINSGNAASEFRWTGGEITYSLSLGAGLTTNITGAGNRDLGRWNWHNGSPWGELINAGTINWHPGSDIRFAYHSASINNSGTFNLLGNGTIQGNYYGGSVTNTGTIEKINTDGATTIGSNLGFTNSGTIKLSLDAPTNTNRLNVGGVTIGGTLNVKFTNGFDPSSSTFLPVITHGARNGTFSSITFENLNGGRSLQARYNPTNLSVRPFMPVSPVPNTPIPENWLKADSLTVPANSAVSTWEDASGKLNHATQTDAARQPKLISNAMNGQPVLRFDGANDQMQIDRTIENDFTITAVFQSKRGIGTSTNWWEAAGIIDGEVPGLVNDFGLALNVDGRIIAGVGNPDTMGFTGPSFNDGKPHIVTFTRQRTSGEFKIYVDGVLRDTKTGSTLPLNSPPRLVIGSRQDNANYLAGDIAEVITYGSLLSDTDRGSIDNYLTAKYISTVPQTVWNAAADFLPNQNGVNGWSYGYIQGGTFNLFTERVPNEVGANIDRWHKGSLGTDPSVRGNLTGNLVDYYGTVRQAANELSLHPNYSGSGTARWTAPETGSYFVSGYFDGNDYGGGTTSDVKLNHNGTTLLASPLNGFGTTIPFNRIITAAQGDTIDFVAGMGTNNNPDHDITGLAATITKTASSISGRVTRATNGAAVAGIVVDLKQNGSVIASATTDIGGGYAFASNLVAGANYVVEPAVGDYSFAPVSASFNNFSGNQTADFAATQIAFFANGDFSIANNNPNGSWSYGWSNSRGSTFNLMNQSGSDATHDYWSQSSVEAVHFARGRSGQNPNRLRTHSGGGGQNSVLRWTAPTAGTYRVFGNFEAGDYNGPQTNVDVAILQNSQTMTSGYAIGGGKVFPYDVTLTVAAGDTVDFSLGRGLDGWYGYDTTFLEATIRPVSAAVTSNSISGITTGNDGTTPIPNTVISLYKDGKLSASALTNAAGDYSFPNLVTNGDYIVSAPATFNPASRSFLRISGAKTANFTTGTSPASPTQCVVPAANLVSWYRGEDNPNDHTGGNNGTLESGVSYVDGKVGRAFDFTANGGVALGDPTNLKITNQITLSAWVKPRPMGDNTFGAVIGKWNNTIPGDSYLMFLYKRPGGGIELADAIGRPQDGDSGFYSNILSNAATIQPDTWTHVAIVYDAANGVNIGYVNGIEVGRRTRTGGITDSTTPIYIGRRNAGGSPIPFNGAIDEPNIFNRVLTAGEIRSVMDADTSGQCSANFANTPQGTNVGTGTMFGSVAFPNVSTAGTTTFTVIDPTQGQPAPPTGYTFDPAFPAYDISSTAVYNGSLIQCLTVPAISDSFAFGRLRILHIEAGVWVDRTLSRDFPTRTICSQTTSLSPFAVADNIGPTAANVSISGRVLQPSGRGIRNAIVRLTDSNGQTRQIRTPQHGSFTFEGVPGGTYVLSVVSKQFTFVDPSRVISVSEDITGVEFTAIP